MLDREIARVEAEARLAEEERTRRAAEIAERATEKGRAKIRAACQGDLLRFTKEVWPIVEPAREFKTGWALEAIAEHLEAVTAGQINRLLMNVPPGFAKALDSETPVLTIWGWKRHGDLRAGDFVFGPDGQPKRVLGRNEPRIEPTLDVTFDDGVSINAGHGHLWAVDRDFPYGGAGGARVRKPKVVTTPDLIASGTGGKYQRPDRITLTEPIQGPHRDFLIDPYILGVWLGDGATDSAAIYAAELDRHHFEKLGRIGGTKKAEGTAKQDFHRIVVEGLQVKLRVMGLLGNKHIPKDYLEAAEDQRWQLLRGLMDTDGTASKDGYCAYVTKLRPLAEQIRTLLCSLGMKPHLSETWTSLKGVKFGPYYQLTFKARTGATIFNLARKQARVCYPQNARSTGRYVKSVTAASPRYVNCISVEGGLYLAGREFVVTHNSLLTDCLWPAWEWGPMAMPHLRYVAFSYSPDLTERDNLRFANVLQSQIYRELWGTTVTLPPRPGAQKVWNHQTGWKLATSVRGVGTGERGDRVVIDDPHNVKESESDAVRKETVRWFRESITTRLIDPITSAIVVIMQRVHEEDVSGVILDEIGGYCTLRIPMEYDGDWRGPTSIGWTDPRTAEGELAFPERFTAEVVERDKIALGPIATASQLQQLPSPRHGNIIERDMWQLWPAEGFEASKFPPCSLILGSVDTAYGEKDENAMNAMTVFGVFNDKRDRPKTVLMEAWQGRWKLRGNYPEGMETEDERKPYWGLSERVADTVRRRNISVLLIENKTRGGDLADEVRRLLGPGECTIIMINPKADKVARLHAVQAIFADGMVYAPERQWAEMVISQVIQFPKGKLADLVDTVSQALSWMRREGILLLGIEADSENANAERFRPAAKPVYDV